MMKLTLLGATAMLSIALATPTMAQEATQEPGMIGFTYPNSNYLRGGYGVRLPNYGHRHSYAYYGPRAYYGPGYVAGPVGLAAGVVGGAIGTAGVIATAPIAGYDSYAYYSDEPGYW
jgi:hypothetical protein